MYGDAMRVFGFAFYEGDYTATGPRGLTSYTAEAAYPGTVEHVLHATGQPRLVLDLRDAAATPAAAWLAQPRPVRQIGALAQDDGFYNQALARLYDGLIYIERSTPSRLLPRR
jgi:erythromycin esterase